LLAINSRNIVWIVRDIIARWRRIWIDIDNVPIVYLKACRVDHFNRLVYLCASVLKNHRDRIVDESRPDNDFAPAGLTLDSFAVHFLLAYADNDMFGSAPKRKKRARFGLEIGNGGGYMLG
jgi:hypothetical protein